MFAVDLPFNVAGGWHGDPAKGSSPLSRSAVAINSVEPLPNTRPIMKLENLVALSALILGTAAHGPHAAGHPASLSADPGTTTGWSFSLTNDTSNFLLVTGSASCPRPIGIRDVCRPHDRYLALAQPGRHADGKLRSVARHRLGAFTFAPSAHGYLSGNLEVFYSLFSADPFTVDDPSSVVVEEDAHADARTEARAVSSPPARAGRRLAWRSAAAAAPPDRRRLHARRPGVARPFHGAEKRVKCFDRPGFCEALRGSLTAILLGRGSPRLGATYRQLCEPHQRWPAVLLRVGIARFTSVGQADRGVVRAFAPWCRAFALPHANLRWRLADHPSGCLTELVSVALILGLRRAAVSRYAALCNPDLPPVRPFGTSTSGGLKHFTGKLSPTHPLQSPA